jgi:hypothetical protein
MSEIMKGRFYATLESKLHEFVLYNNGAKPFMKIFVWINSIVMSTYTLIIVFWLSKIEISEKLAKKGTLEKFWTHFGVLY